MSHLHHDEFDFRGGPSFHQSSFEDTTTEATESDVHFFQTHFDESILSDHPPPPLEYQHHPQQAPSRSQQNNNDYHQGNHNHTLMEDSSFSTFMFKDCTETVHHMHNLLLYLLSNPSEFQEAIDFHKNKSTTSTLSAFHAEYDRATDVGSVFHDVVGSSSTSGGTMTNVHPGEEENIPVPFMVFAADAEVVLPQAHTASQLFGYERDSGIELEATSGMVGLCQLFLRWLALMPGGDHTNLIEPPGLTVMRIAGGRYRVTAAHRVVWTWKNEFLHDPVSSNNSKDYLHYGDLVSMTIVDVFETDCDGKLLSYCPTFDNRAIYKTDQTVERLRKSSSKIKRNIHIVANSQTAARVNKAACLLGELSVRAAVTVKDTVQKKIEEERKKKESPLSSPSSPNDVKNVQHLEMAVDEFKENKKVHSNSSRKELKEKPKVRSEHYVSDDESTNYDC